MLSTKQQIAVQKKKKTWKRIHKYLVSTANSLENSFIFSIPCYVSVFPKCGGGYVCIFVTDRTSQYLLNFSVMLISIASKSTPY